MNKITHCIFDMDGLLLDSERIYTEVTQQILDKHTDGKVFTWDVKSQLMGRTGNEAATIVVETYELPMSPDEYINVTSEILEELFPHVQFLEGVERLIRHLHAHKVPIAVATGSNRERFELKTSRHKSLFDLFDAIVCGDDPEVKNGKPCPDLFLVAQKRLGNPPSENCLVFEDAPNGIEAGLNAKMNVVWIPDENIKKLTGTENHGATIVLNSMAEFDPSQFSLPPF